MLYKPTIMTNMDIVHYLGLYRRGNVIWVKVGIGSIWETRFYIEPQCHSYRMRMVSYIEPQVQRMRHLVVQYRQYTMMNHGLETID